MKIFKCKPGFCPGTLKHLKNKTNIKYEQERNGTLIFDEIKIKNYLKYLKFLDIIKGLKDLRPLKRSN